MKFKLSVLLVALLATFCAANDRILTVTKSGYYLTVQDENGEPSYVRIETVIDLRGENGPTAPDEPDVDLELVSKVQEWATTVDDPQSAQAIAAVYAHIRGALNDGVLTPANVWTPLKQSTDSAIGVIASESDWSGFRSKLTAEFTEAQQRGQLGTPEQISAVLLSVQHGVELSADGSAAITMDQLVEIARRTNMAIDGATK